MSVARGRAGEDLAAAYLTGQGLRIVARNVRCKLGELDLVARDGDRLVFVEVKERGKLGHGDGLDAVTATKRRRLVRAALWYAQREGLSEGPVRFDVVAIERLADGSARLRHEPGAFDADGR